MLVVTPWMYQGLIKQIEEEKVKLKVAIEERVKGVQSFKSDNCDSAYHHDCRIQAMIQKKLVELEILRNRAQVIVTEKQTDILKIGNRAIIIYKDRDDVEEMKVTLEGHIISDRLSSEYTPVSIKSPVGSKIQNLRLSESAIADLGGKKITLTIKKIFPPIE